MRTCIHKDIQKRTQNFKRRDNLICATHWQPNTVGYQLYLLSNVNYHLLVLLVHALYLSLNSSFLTLLLDSLVKVQKLNI